MIEKVDTSQIQSFVEKASSRPNKSGDACKDNDEAVAVQVDFASFIESAIKIPQNDSRSLEKAKEILLSGKLESKENIEKTAKNIVTYGI
jgi:hypothetical protein